MPTKQASSPSAVGCVGSRIIVAGPPKRGISLPPSGWLNGLVVIVVSSGGALFHIVCPILNAL